MMHFGYFHMHGMAGMQGDAGNSLGKGILLWYVIKNPLLLYTTIQNFPLYFKGSL
jgi:hypothetical protein